MVIGHEMSSIGFKPAPRPHFQGHLQFPLETKSFHQPPKIVETTSIMIGIAKLREKYPDYVIRENSFQTYAGKAVGEVYISKPVQCPWYLKPLGFLFKRQARKTPDADQFLKNALVGLGVPADEIKVKATFSQVEIRTPNLLSPSPSTF